MAITSKWRQHIEAWQSSSLLQAEYCVQHRINVRTFTARLSDYRKRPATDSVALVPVRIDEAEREAIAIAPPKAAVIVSLPMPTAIDWSFHLQYRQAGWPSC